MRDRHRFVAPFTLVLLVLLTGSAAAQSYEVDRRTTGPMAFLVRGVEHNEGSSLNKRSILLNDPAAPIELTSYEGQFDYKDRDYVLRATIDARARDSVQAYETRHVLFNVFGEHLENLSHTAVTDLGAGKFSKLPSWRILQEHDVFEHMITVSYVAHVRLADGTIWSYDRDRLMDALAELDLEGKLEDEEDGTP